MKALRLLLPGVLAFAAAHAENAFPGLQKIMTESEWKRAGLDRLTPDQIGVIDAALIRHAVAAAGPGPAAAAAPASPVPPPNATPAEAAVVRARFWEKFGLGKLTSSEWRNQPPMTAKVTAWQGANRFALDTGQVWEGLEPIPFELLGQDVIIEARPLGAYALKLNENSMSVRVHRIR